ncbi:MAG TPA: hypothetical protein VG871_11490 [Vicinamibacterales bacterium]|nr:hypothetical protein [Vicinamibacterales bacterium]
MAVPLPDSTAELFTPANITAVGIATAAVMAVTNTFKVMFNVPPRRTAFAASLVIAYLVVAIKPMPPWYEWILAFFNACLLFLSALGLNETAAAPPSAKGIAAPRRFFESWTHR